MSIVDLRLHPVPLNKAKGGASTHHLPQKKTGTGSTAFVRLALEGAARLRKGACDLLRSSNCDVPVSPARAATS